ncbi:hypothetical protein ACQKML_00550 [Peribacillus frigoritolerans]
MIKIKFMILGLFFYCITSTVSYAFAEGTIVNDTVDFQVKQNLYLEIPKEGGTPEELEELIDIYESAGWIANGDYFIKEVNQQDVTVEYADETYQTSSNGTVQFPIEENQGEEIEVSVNTTSDEKDVYLVDIDKVSTNEVVQDIYLDEILEDMSNEYIGEEQASETTNQNTSDIVGSVSAGTSYKKGDTVHCNRFNGYLGDGKYYDKKKHPVLAAKNFIQSDCDVALARYNHCLKDYGEVKKRYCSNYSATNKGRCSILSKVGHSRKYHKHTGFFSPSS